MPPAHVYEKLPHLIDMHRMRTNLEGYTLIVNSLPWRNKLDMSNAVELLSRTNNAWMDGNFDAILPPLNTILSSYDQLSVHQDCRRVVRRNTTSLLELYELVYRIVVQGTRVSPATLILFRSLFAV